MLSGTNFSISRVIFCLKNYSHFFYSKRWIVQCVITTTKSTLENSFQALKIVNIYFFDHTLSTIMEKLNLNYFYFQLQKKKKKLSSLLRIYQNQTGTLITAI